MSLSLDTREVDGVVIIDAVGRMTLGEGSVNFREKIRYLVQQGKKQILLNGVGITFVDGSGVAEMVSAFTTITNHGGEFKILNLTKI